MRSRSVSALSHQEGEGMNKLEIGHKLPVNAFDPQSVFSWC